MTKKQVFNPYLPSYEYIPDGEPHVFDGRLYIYGSHDRFDGELFCMNDYVSYSADIHDLKEWRYEGVIYRKDQDPRNPEGIRCMWAPDVVRGLDGRYYLYYCLDWLPQIGVAVCDTPAGSYEFLGLVKHPDGTPLGDKQGDLIQFDPGIFIDEDGSIYLYSGNAPTEKNQEGCGNRGSQVMRLEEDMVTLKEEPKELLPTVDNSEGTGFEGHEFFEASSIRKINGTYYFVYSSVQSHELCYAVSTRPDGGYRYGGTLVSIGDIGYQGRTQEDAVNFLGNTHGGIECADGKWYVFYHRQTNWTQYSRQGCAEEIEILPDGSIPQVEMTSCGLNGGPLEGLGEYEARIACNLRGKEGVVMSLPKFKKFGYPCFTQDGQDREDNPNQYIADMTDGAEAGFKYFDFGQVKEVCVKVRGKGEGRFIISQISGASSKDGNVCGTVEIQADSDDWTVFTGELHVPQGKGPLYFRYEGEGTIDFYSFILQ